MEFDDKYAIKLLKQIKEIEVGLKYYIESSHRHKNEAEVYQQMYENRVNKYLNKEAE